VGFYEKHNEPLGSSKGQEILGYPERTSVSKEEPGWLI
jgi:hypothetical protein